MTDMITGTGTGTEGPFLRPSVPGTDGDSATPAGRDRSPGTNGTGPTPVVGTAGTAATPIPGTADPAGTGTAPVPATAQGPVPAADRDKDKQSRPARRGPFSRFRDRRDRHAAASLQSLERREGQRAERDRRDQETRDQAARDSAPRDRDIWYRDARDRSAAAALALGAALDMQRTAKGQAAKAQAAKRQVNKGDNLDGPPIPAWMQLVGLWIERTFGSMPLIAPLIVSGYFTFRAGWDVDGMDLPWTLAILLSVAFEGGVWKLSRINEKSLVAGYSTIAIRLGLGLYLTIISSVIYWHETMKVGGLDHLKDANWIPAAAAALLSSLGVYIQGRAARWARRAELEATGRMDKQAIKLSGVSWLFTPIINIKVIRHSVKYRLDSTLDAVRDYRLWRAAGKPKTWPQLPSTGTDGPQDIAAVLRVWGIDAASLAQGQGQGQATGLRHVLPGINLGPGTPYPGPGAGPVPAVPPLGAGQVPPAAGTGPSVPGPLSPGQVPGAVPAQSPRNGTGPSDPAVPPVPPAGGDNGGDKGPAVTVSLADGSTIEERILLDYAQRHRVRLDRVLSNKPAEAADGFDWMNCPLLEVKTRWIKDAGGFAKQEWAGEIRKVILAIRAGYNPYAVV